MSAEQAQSMVEEIAHRTAWRYKHSSDPAHSHTYTFNRLCLLDFAEELRSAERDRCARVCGAMYEALREATPLDGSRAAVAQELERRIRGLKPEGE